MKRYSKMMVVLHWLSAALLLIILFASELMPLMPHMVLGGLIAVLFISRILIKTNTSQPEEINTNRFLSLAGKATHWLLYFVVLATAGSGLALAIEADLFNVVLNGLAFPEGVDELFSRSMHDLFEHALKAVLLLHIGAALFHQFVLKDRIFSRMGWGK